jgi:hypothetical protein
MDCRCVCIPKCCETKNCSEEVCDCKKKFLEQETELEIEFVPEEKTIH